MIAALPTQEQVDQIARTLAPDVVSIRFRVSRDWSGDPAIYFRVVLSDEVSRQDRVAEVARQVRDLFYERLGLDDLDHIPYFSVRSDSENKKLEDKAWD